MAILPPLYFAILFAIALVPVALTQFDGRVVGSEKRYLKEKFDDRYRACRANFDGHDDCIVHRATVAVHCKSEQRSIGGFAATKERSTTFSKEP